MNMAVALAKQASIRCGDQPHRDLGDRKIPLDVFKGNNPRVSRESFDLLSKDRRS